MPASKQLQHALPYYPDSATLFSSLANLPWAVFLDSGYPNSQQGRYDIIASKPVCTLVTFNGTTTICSGDNITESIADPFELLKQQLAGFDCPPSGDLPFNGGAIGYFAYDLARHVEKLPVIAENTKPIPDMAVGIYRWAVIVDHLKQATVLVGQNCGVAEWQDLIAHFSQLLEPSDTDSFEVTSEIVADMDQAAYSHAFNRIKHYLREGDCYQVNLTQGFTADCQGNPWTAYQVLRQLNAAPFSAYLNFPDVQILCSSPERFLKLQHGVVETKPIKGTRPRKHNAIEDQEQIKALLNSNKDRAENLMIVDLLRNDIGKVCKHGSVKVPTLFAVETYATVHHLVSTVTGILAKNRHALDLLRSCFPGGSITGAPKIRAMEVIEELEPHRRGVYCGAIGYIGFDGNMDTNIAIRTLAHTNGSIRFWAGGGIVNDSQVDEEYQECFDKAAAMIAMLQQFGCP